MPPRFAYTKNKFLAGSMNKEKHAMKDMDHENLTWYQSRHNHDGLGLSSKITHMGDPGKKKMKQEEIDALEDFGSETKEPIFKIDSFVKFVDFMKDLLCDKTAYKQKKEFKDNINEVFAWFHKNCLGKDIQDRLPPKLAGLEVCLFELVKLVEGMGGYYEVSQKQEWDEVAMGFGYPENYDMNFKFMYEDYLLQAVHFFELARNNTVGTVVAPEGLGDEVGETNSTSDHVDWYIDHIKAIEDDGKAVATDEDNKQGFKTSMDHNSLEDKEPEPVDTQDHETTGTFEDCDDFIIIT